MKKAQSLSMNTIVIAALALLVLVIIALITTGRISLWSRESAECSNNGGACKLVCADTEKQYNAAKCTKIEGEATKVCCMPLT